MSAATALRVIATLMVAGLGAAALLLMIPPTEFQGAMKGSVIVLVMTWFQRAIWDKRL